MASGRRRGVSAFLEGVQVPFRATGLILRTPRLLLACLIPWSISGSIAWFLFSAISAQAGVAVAWLASLLHFSASGVLASVLSGVLQVLSWLAGAFFLVWLAGLAALPFADWLAEMTERQATPPLAPATELSGWFTRDHWRRVRLEIYKSGAGMALSVLGLMLSSVPMVGVLGIVALALGMTFQFVAYPQARRGEGVGQSLGFLLRRFPASLGFGLVLLLAFSIPFFSALVFPVAVVGGTLLYAAQREE